MKFGSKLAGTVVLIGMTTACGHVNPRDVSTMIAEEDSTAEGSSTEFQENAELFALSLPIAQRNPQGVIVVERSVLVEPGVNGNPPSTALKCLLPVASHLAKVEGGRETLPDGSESSSFTATVIYPSGLKFAVSKSSCAEGQRVIVRQGRNFQGLAVTKKQAGTKFDMLGKASVVALGAPQLCSAIDSVKGCVPTPIYTPSCSVYAGRQNIRISDDGQILKGSVVGAGDLQIDSSLRDECALGSELQIRGSSISMALSSVDVIPIKCGGYPLPRPEEPTQGGRTPAAFEVAQPSATDSLK